MVDRAAKLPREAGEDLRRGLQPGRAEDRQGIAGLDAHDPGGRREVPGVGEGRADGLALARDEGHADLAGALDHELIARLSGGQQAVADQRGQ